MKSDAQRHVRNALLNILAFPGLGSLRSGRWLAGVGQLLLLAAGTALMLAWLFKELSQYYGLMFGDEKPRAIGWIGEIGGVLFGISWLWSCVTSFSLFQEASKSEAVPPVLVSNAKIERLSPEIHAALAALPEWTRQEQVISRTYEFKDFPAAMKFVNAVAEVAEQAQHHPDIDVRWNKVRLALTTHDAGGLTAKDFALARECDGQAAAVS